MSYKCELVEQIPQPVLSVRTRAAVGDLPKVLGEKYGKIYQYITEIGEYPAGAPFVAYYNMDMEDLDLEIGFPVSKELDGREEIQAGMIPGGKQATCLYVGSYQQMEEPYNALMQWMKDKGYTATGVAYEFYLNDPAETPEDELQTRIAFPLVESR